MKKPLWRRAAALVLASVLTLSLAQTAMAEDMVEDAEPIEIVPISLPINISVDPALAESLVLLTAYYSQTTPESWEDFLAACALGVLPEDAALPEYGNLATLILCALAAQRNPYELPGCPPDALAVSQKADGSFGESLSDHVYAMLALDRAPSPKYRRDKAEDYLLSCQREDGSFEAWGGVVEPTALALLALSGEPAERAAAFLLAQMTEEGGFVGYPDLDPQDDSCTAAVALSGLIAAGAEIPAEAVTRLLSHQDENGLFSWKLGMDADPLFATPQCALAVAQLVGGSVFETLPSYVITQYTPPYGDWDTVPLWAQDGVLFALERGLMTGNANGDFLSNRVMTRAELAAILMSLGLSREPSAQTEYTDVRPSDWFAGAVRYVSENGLMWGEDGLFQPHRPLTREETAFWLAQALDLVVTGQDTAPADLAMVTPEYADAVHAMFDEGLMIGDGTRFYPGIAVRRADMAVLLQRLHG